MREHRPYCKINNKPCYDKKGAITAKNKRWKQDRILLRVYHCSGRHWHVTKMGTEKPLKQKIFIKKKSRYKDRYD